MKTLPDAIDDVKYFWKRTRDIFCRVFEHWGSRINSYAWIKRWKNRKEGTGYGREDKYRDM